VSAPPGAQWERTRLAWRRTSLAFAVAGALAVRSALYDGGAAAYAAAACGALVWLVFLGVSHYRIRHLADGGTGVRAPAPVVAAVLCTWATVLLGVVLLW
jgi:uncharacterized membrane protein YidH (DUF202 family)